MLVAATIGLTVQRPLAWLTSHSGINALLVVLVFSTAVTIEPAALRRAAASWRPLVFTLIVGATILPGTVLVRLTNGERRIATRWSDVHRARTVRNRLCGHDGHGQGPGGPVRRRPYRSDRRHRGDRASPILALESGHAAAHPTHIVVNLVLVVALPFAVGLAARAIRPLGDRSERAALTVATISVAALVGLIAAEIHFSAQYLAVAGSLFLFLAASIVIGRLVGSSLPRPSSSSVLLTISMRDFAIAAGLATAASGASTAAALGLYGVLVLLWGTGAAGWLRKRR